MALPWFKFYGAEYLGDPKMMALTPCERSCWLTLLCYACTAEDDGRIKFLTEERLMVQAGLSFQHEEWQNTIGVLKKLEKLEMIHIDNDVITITNWIKRQEQSLTGYERIKRYREKKKNDNALITVDKIRVDKIRKDNTDKGRFTPPTLEEIKTYCTERNNNVDPQRFYDFYASKGWMVGKNKMKDWQAAVRTWEKSDNQTQGKRKTNVTFL